MLDRIQKVNYFVIILDSTPDISHTDQMSLICRYFVVENKEVDALESFLGFIAEHGKTSYCYIAGFRSLPIYDFI